MTQEEAIARLSKFESPTPSAWREEAQAVREAKSEGWLQYSRRIAIKMAMAMKQQQLTRADVAARMGCSPQYVSRMLKGEENLSLQTISKVEDALGVPILQYELA